MVHLSQCTPSAPTRASPGPYSIRLAIARPFDHQFSALFENVSASVGTLHLIADLMPHGFFNHRMWQTRDFFGPSPEG
jgi:hypothetical protein